MSVSVGASDSVESGVYVSTTWSALIWSIMCVFAFSTKKVLASTRNMSFIAVCDHFHGISDVLMFILRVDTHTYYNHLNSFWLRVVLSN